MQSYNCGKDQRIVITFYAFRKFQTIYRKTDADNTDIGKTLGQLIEAKWNFEYW